MSRVARAMSAENSAAAAAVKRLYIVRHGQAQHNPRAEAAKAAGCDMEEFFELMRQDDVADAPLTDLGMDQARSASATILGGVELVVASSLSRALHTADLVLPSTAAAPAARRISLELFREINGKFLNGRRRSSTELRADFEGWNFDELDGEEDSTWTPELETYEAAAERGYRGLRWLLGRDEKSMLLVSHGGILRYMMTIHPLIRLRDGRADTGVDLKPVDSRFENCEIRGYDLRWGSDDEDECDDGDERVVDYDDDSRSEGRRRSIVLTQVDH